MLKAEYENFPPPSRTLRRVDRRPQRFGLLRKSLSANLTEHHRSRTLQRGNDH